MPAYEDGDGCRRRGKDGSPHARGQREGEGGSRTVVGVAERRRTTRVAPTKVGMGVGGVGKMGPRMREQRVPAPLRGSCRTRRGATTRVAPTGGMGVGGVGKMGPRMARTTGGGGRFPNRPYVGVAEHDVGGQPQGLPAYEGRGKDGSPHARGQREGEGGLRGKTEPQRFPTGGWVRLWAGRTGAWERWVPASARTTGGGGRFPNRPYVGVAEHDVMGSRRWG